MSSALKHDPDISINVLDANGGTIAELIQSPRFEQMDADQRGRLLASVIEQAWEIAADIDSAREHPNEPSVVNAIRDHWRGSNDADDTTCNCCGSSDISPARECERCHLLPY